MSKDIRWVDGHIETDPPKRLKKITGTRLGAILGVNPWSSPFQVWSQCTKTYEPPFEDTIYTKAGKAIESKQIKYLKEIYGMTDIKTPEDIYGKDFFKKTYGDFYPQNKILGGMNDAKRVDEKGATTAVIECKTTKRSEDWQTDIPEYYALQAALYAYLEGCDKVIMICSFLEDKDYDDPDAFIPSAYNTIVKPFNLSERYPHFKELYINTAINWYTKYVLNGISPDYDEHRDAEYLKALRTNTLGPTTDIQALLKEAEELKVYLDNMDVAKAEQEKRYKVVTEQLKEYATEQFRDGDKQVVLDGGSYKWIVSKGVSSAIDKKKLEEDGLLDKYTETKETYRLTVKGGNQ